MPAISEKSKLMPASPIRKLVPFAELAKNQGKQVFHLNIGQPDIHSPKVALNAVKNIQLDVIEYSHSAGFESYRKGLSKYYENHGIDVTKDEIIVTTGGSEALLFGFISCFNPGDEVIIPEPFYANYNSFAVATGVKVTPVKAKIEDGFSLPPMDAFKDAITERTKGILICNPGNPTGYLYTQDELNTIRDLVLENDLFLFADEVYREFTYDGKKHISILQLEGLEQNAILVDSVSKRYSMCGARIGAMVTHNKEVLEGAMKMAQARLSPPTLAQIASEAALNAPQSYFDDVNEEYVKRRNVMVDGLNAIEGVTCPKPSGAFYCVAELPVKNAEHFCQWMLESFDYQGNTVMMAPAAGFYSQPGSGLNQVRIAYVLEIDALKQALECLEKGLVAYQN